MSLAHWGRVDCGDQWPATGSPRPRDQGTFCPLASPIGSLSHCKVWWARQDSNLEPRDYENHEIIGVGAASLRTGKDFPGGPSAGNGDRTFRRTVHRTLSISRARDDPEFLIGFRQLALLQCKSCACATEPPPNHDRTEPNRAEPDRTGSGRPGSARRNSQSHPRKPDGFTTHTGRSDCGVI